jgi:hypothetical protein
MNEYVTLYDVIDIRTNKYHSVVSVKQKYAKYFVPAVTEEEAE